eukprot:3936006-Prymnesium_polylepis.1
MNGTASIGSVIYSCFSAAVATVCSFRILDLSSGRAMSRQQGVVCAWTRARGTACLRRADRRGA